MKIGYLMQLGAEIRSPPFNGPANHVRHVVQGLEKLGHEVQVLYRLNNQTWYSKGLEQFSPVNVDWTDQSLLHLSERMIRRTQATLHLPYFNLFESMQFASACQEKLVSCDLFYERTSWMGYGGAIASRKTGIPLFLEDNGDHLDDLDAKGIAPQGIQRWLSLQLMHFGMHQAKYVISTGQGWRNRFIDRWDFPSEKISVIENGTTLIEKLKRSDLKSFNPLPESDKTIQIVYLGGFYPWHGVPVLLKAFTKACQKNKYLRLILIGAGDGFEYARESSHSLGISDYVTFTGHLGQDEFARLLAQADIGTSPYCGWPEYSGLKIFDYKAAGLPTLASGQNGHPTTIVHGETGWIVPPCDEDSLSDGILVMSSRRDHLRKMGQQARIEAENIHTWQHTVQQIDNTLLEVLSFQQRDANLSEPINTRTE